MSIEGVDKFRKYWFLAAVWQRSSQRNSEKTPHSPDTAKHAGTETHTVVSYTNTTHRGYHTLLAERKIRSDTRRIIPLTIETENMYGWQYTGDKMHNQC